MCWTFAVVEYKTPEIQMAEFIELARMRGMQHHKDPVANTTSRTGVDISLPSMILLDFRQRFQLMKCSR